ncbi:HtaA domain-containing protein [Kribbella sp. NPDC056345]|uniref:HtaA domain-containing protein n=1 Tax=Kribbella sp. NPDC056345 TaxID=3345789 RepID=UPI0035DE0A7C
MSRRLGFALFASLAAVAASSIGLNPASAEVTPTPAVPTFTPKIEVSKTSEITAGEDLVVKGSGFDPAANASLRPPVTVGQPAGVYVVFGSFADNWQPSTGADATTRTLLDTKWAVPQPSYDQVSTDFPAQKPRMVLLNPDGTFELTVKTKKVAENPRNYGVYTYPGGGAVNAAHELAVKVTFAGDTPPTTPPPPVGSLDWGLKASFRTYVEGPIAHGSIAVQAPATRRTDGSFRFANGTGTAEKVGFEGGVYFKGHEMQAGNPLLEVTVRDLRIALNGSTGKIIADVVSKSLETGQPATYDDVELAALDFATKPVEIKDGVATVVGAPATLTSAGVPAFAGFYAAGTALDPVSFAVRLTTTPTWQPKIDVLGPDGKPLGTVPAAGVVATVRGSGFDPASNPSTRPPVTPGKPAGVYVVFGSFDKTWRPSEGAPAGARRVLDQKWALPDASRPGQDPAFVTLNPDGTFEATVNVKPADTASGTYGIATYAAGGAAPNAPQELLKPVVFGGGTAVLTVAPHADLSDGQTVRVTGAGYAPNRALYVAQTPQGTSGSSNPSPFSGAQRVVTTAAGTFETTVQTAVTFTNEGVKIDCEAVACYLASFNSPLASDNEAVDLRGDRTQDVFRAITFKNAGPQPVLPVVTAQPRGLAIVAGGNVEFTAAATGTPVPTVQWERSGDEGKMWAPIASPSAVTSTLKVDAVQAADNGARFRAVFSNAAGSATSAAAVLTVAGADPKVTVTSAVKQGGELVAEGSGFPAGRKVSAAVDGATDAPEFSFSNANGQTVTVSSANGKALSVAGGKLVLTNGAQLAVKVSGLRNSRENTAAAPNGFYVMTAVDNGAGQTASPAIGGADLTGKSGQSAWITNYPYAGSENIVVRIGTDLVARTTVTVASKDDLTDCTSTPRGCVLYLRADHRSTANRAFDVRVPLEFATASALAVGTTLGEQEADADGNVRFAWKVPNDFAIGKHVLTLMGPSGLTASANFSVTSAVTPMPTPTPTPSPTTTQPPVTNPPTKPTGSLANTGGAGLWLPIGGAVLLLTGLLITFTTRRKHS